MNNQNCLNFEILDIVRAGRSKTYFPQKNIGTYLLSCRLSGETVFLHDDGNFTLGADDVFYVPMGSKYSQYDHNDVEFICFHLEIHGGAPGSMHRCHPENAGEIREMFCRAAELWRKRKPGYAYECMALLYAIFARTIALAVSQTDGNRSILGRSIAYMNSHLFDINLSLDEVCKASNISRVYFNRLFMEQFGTTPIKYINHKRIEKAKLLLKSGSFAREETASLCGFKDVKYFYTVFKSITGMTTSEYCRQIEM